MKIKQSKAKNLIAIISIDVTPEDYNTKVDKVLSDYRRTAVVPGFRKGKTPINIINKKYRASVLVEEVNKLLQDGLYKHITENKVKVLGSPMPLDENQIDWEKDQEFKFLYEIGLAPDFELNITSKDKLDYYKIKADSKLIEGYCTDIAKRHGKMSNAKKSVEGDLIYCTISQLDIDDNIINNGVQNDATVSMDYISDNKIRKRFIGLNIGDELKIDVRKAFSNLHDLRAMLDITDEQLSSLKSERFNFLVKNINRLEPAKLNKELFDKVYGIGSVKDLKGFKTRIKEDAEHQFISESDRMLKNDVVTYLIDKLKLKMPDEFLKRWLVKTSEQPITMEMLESEYGMYAKSLQWQLIENRVLQKYDIQVTQEDVIDKTKELVKSQMKQYGQEEVDDKKLAEIANNILKNKEESKKIYDQIIDQRTLLIYKEKVKLKEKIITYDDFVKLASEK